MGIPLFRGNMDSRAVINPRDQIRYDEAKSGRRRPYPEKLILCFTGEVLRSAQENHDVKLVEKNWWGWLYVVNGGGSQIGMLQSGIGDSFAGLVLELLIARGATDIIAVGTAGGLQRRLKIGDIVLVERAIRDEGVSYHYAKASKYALASARLNRKIEDVLRKMKLHYEKGTTWTNDAPFRETITDTRKFQKEGVLCVEMEAASLFSIGKFRGVDVGGLCWISDDISRLKWDPQFNTEAYDRGRNNAVEAAIRTFSI